MNFSCPIRTSHMSSLIGDDTHMHSNVCTRYQNADGNESISKGTREKTEAMKITLPYTRRNEDFLATQWNLDIKKTFL